MDRPVREPAPFDPTKDGELIKDFAFIRFKSPVVHVYDVQIDGAKLVYGAYLEGGADPNDITLGELKAYPALTACIMLERLRSSRFPAPPVGSSREGGR